MLSIHAATLPSSARCVQQQMMHLLPRFSPTGHASELVQKQDLTFHLSDAITSVSSGLLMNQSYGLRQDGVDVIVLVVDSWLRENEVVSMEELAIAILEKHGLAVCAVGPEWHHWPHQARCHWVKH